MGPNGIDFSIILMVEDLEPFLAKLFQKGTQGTLKSFKNRYVQVLIFEKCLFRANTRVHTNFLG